MKKYQKPFLEEVLLQSTDVLMASAETAEPAETTTIPLPEGVYDPSQQG